MMDKNDDYWMRMAIDLAKESKTPFGAVILDPQQQFVGGYNTSIHDGPLAHAEMNVLSKIKDLDYDQPEDLTIYSTVEPCPMCMSAIVWAGIGRLVYGVSIEYTSNFGNQIEIKSATIAEKAWYSLEISSGIELEKCKALFN